MSTTFKANNIGALIWAKRVLKNIKDPADTKRAMDLKRVEAKAMIAVKERLKQ